MDTNMKNETQITNEDMHKQESVETDELSDVIGKALSNIRTQSMLLGAQAICQTVADKIYKFESSYGKKTANDYKRLIKDINKFCEIGLSRKVNPDGTTEEVNTVQN